MVRLPAVQKIKNSMAVGNNGVLRMYRSVLMAIAIMATLLGMTAQGSTAALEARIDISSQQMTVSHYGRVLYSWPVSTARAGYVTPRGSYRPQRLARMWYSRKYDMSPMPHSVFFHGGYAVHATNYVKRLGTPASHGCVRLHPAAAADFYTLVRTFGPSNTSIVITE